MRVPRSLSTNLNVDRLWNVPLAMLGVPLSPVQERQERQHQQLADNLGPLFTMYWNMAEEEDKKMTECWQKDAKPIIIFVRISLLFSMLLHVSTQYYRPVCSLPLLHHFLPSQSSTSSETRRKPPTSTSRISISFKFSRAPVHLSLPPQLNLLPSPHQHT
jgi:hypothetical protein